MEKHYYIRYDEYTYMITPPSDDPGPWADRGSSGVNVTINSIHESKPEGPHEVVREDFDASFGVDDIPVGATAWVVLVEYTDGDTFGSSGYWKIAGVFSNVERAVEARTAIYKGDTGAHGAKDGYAAWQGYFAHIDAVETVPVTMRP